MNDWSVLSGSRVSRRTLLKMAGAGAAVAMLPSCAGDTTTGQGGGGGTPKKGGTLNAGWYLSEFANLYPQLIELGLEMQAAINIFDGLTRITPNLDIEGVLAESWEISEDGRTYTFKLRKGVKWHNGDDFTADDVLFSYEQVSDPKFGSAHISKVEPIKSVDAPDDFTVVFDLKQPFSPFLSVVTNFPGRALTPVNQTAFNELGREKYNLEPVGTGPFKVVEHTQGQQLVLERFEDYWDPDVPLLDEIRIKNIPEASTVNSAIQAGDIDFINQPPEQFVPQLEGVGSFEVLRKVGTNWLGLQMNYHNASADFFTDVNVRMALAKAVDRETLAEKAYFGQAVPALGVLNPAVPWAWREDKPDDQDFNLDEAKKLLSDADATGITIDLTGPTESQREMEVLADMLSKLDVNINLDLQEETVYFTRRDEGDYQMIHSGSVTDPDPDESVYLFFHSGEDLNSYDYSNPEADELLEAQRLELDEDKRAEILGQLEDILIKDVAAGFTVHLEDVTVFNKKVQGFEHVPELRPLGTVWLDE
jgi:peptide/nickel transport system substrate-binding protein